jgi:hypothetical protein
MNPHPKAWVIAVSLVIVGLWCAGCASPSVNPQSAQPGVGYADFYCKDAPALAWDVRQRNPDKKLFYSPDPVEKGILRLAFAPGSYRVTVSFLNQVVPYPGEVGIEIKEGMVTPVQAHLVPGEDAAIVGKTVHAGGTVYGRAGRTTKITTEGADTFRVELNAEPPLAFAKKEHMPYAR